MMYYEPIDVVASRMKFVGEMMVSTNPPRGPVSNEEILSPLKDVDLVVDGYEVSVYYTKSDFGNHFTEIVQIYSLNSPFLPFCLLCKIVKKFLGDKELSLVEIFRSGHKIYCWSVNLNKDGQPIPPPYSIQYRECEYEGLRYKFLEPSQVEFY